MEGNIKITTFNCAGFKYRNFGYLKEVFGRCDILLLQETWLFNFQHNEFNKVLPNCHYHAVSTMDESEVGRVGRPYGGCAILWHSNLALTCVPVNTISPRICAVQIKSNSLNILVINVYMPNDINNDENIYLYGDVLSEISSIINLYDDSEIIIGGDLNVDFSRNESINLGLFKQFIIDEQLICATLPIVNNNYTRVSSSGDRSFIDHFLVCENVNFNNLFVSVDGTNLSDHMPVTIETLYLSNKLNETSNSRVVNNWKKATEIQKQNYKDRLDYYITNIIVPSELQNCNNLMCKEHDQVINQLLEEAINTMIYCANETIPTRKIPCKNKGIPGWNDFVQPYKDSSIYWNNIWKSAGSPPNGQLAEKRRFARYKYHWAIRKVKKDKDMIIRNKTAEQLSRKSFNNFWKTIKQLKGTDKKIAKVIDGYHTSNDISSHFSSIYEKLYNSVQDDEFDDLNVKVNILVSRKCCHTNCSQINCQNITREIMQKAINCLSGDKDDETYGISSDHFINASDQFVHFLSRIITFMLKHGTSSHVVNKAIIKPIPKNKQKSLTDSSNYRAITKNTIISKIIDYVIIILLGDKMTTSSYQFAYKEKISTSLCSFLVAETIQYYRSRGSNVYMLSLDATKATKYNIQNFLIFS